MALNADNGEKIWESRPIQKLGGTFVLTAPPLVWNNYVIAGSAFGDVPFEGTNATASKGSITALNKSTGKVVWKINTTAGDWVKGKNASINGGATVWSGGAIDVDKGIAYLPCGNPAPDFDASTRPGKALYSNSVIAVDITTGKILWSTLWQQARY